MIIWDLEIEFF